MACSAAVGLTSFRWQPEDAKTAKRALREHWGAAAALTRELEETLERVGPVPVAALSDARLAVRQLASEVAASQGPGGPVLLRRSPGQPKGASKDVDRAANEITQHVRQAVTVSEELTRARAKKGPGQWVGARAATARTAVTISLLVWVKGRDLGRPMPLARSTAHTRAGHVQQLPVGSPPASTRNCWTTDRAL